MPDILVIGGGISGVAAAYEMARTGARVTVLEARRLGAMASGWTLGGVRQSGRDPAELPLAIAAVRRWTTLDEELGAQTGYRRHGNLRLARNEAEIDVIKALVASQTAQGLDLTFLPDRAAIRAVAPVIGDSVLAASFCPGDGHADPDATVQGYAAAARRHGADIREGVRVRSLRLQGGRVIGVETDDGPFFADRVVVATGIHAPELLAPCGVALPLSVRRVCVLQTVPSTEKFLPVFGVANADAAGRQERDGRFRVTTGIGDWPGDPAGWTQDALQPGCADIARLIERTTAILPCLSGLGINRVWGGLIDLTPDALPVIDADTGVDGLVVAAGFSGHGFGIGPVTGEIISALTLGGTQPYDLAPFRAGRFASRQAFAPLTLHG